MTSQFMSSRIVPKEEFYDDFNDHLAAVKNGDEVEQPYTPENELTVIEDWGSEFTTWLARYLAGFPNLYVGLDKNGDVIMRG